MSKKVKMRPVTAGNRRTYNKAIDTAEAQDPFQSMYSQAYGGRPSSAQPKK